LQAKNNKYLKSVHVEFTEKKLQYLFRILIGIFWVGWFYFWILEKALLAQGIDISQ
jgi:hypothetical protein